MRTLRQAFTWPFSSHDAINQRSHAPAGRNHWQRHPGVRDFSHTWEEEEVIYSHQARGVYGHMKGYYKIDMTCHTAEDFRRSLRGMLVSICTRLYLDIIEYTLILPLSCALDESGNINSIILLHLGNRHYLRLDTFSLYLHKLDTVPAEQSPEKYLLPEHSLISGSHKPWESLNQIKVRTRLAYPRILPFSRNPHVYNPWLLELYDRAEQPFLVSEDQSRDTCCGRTGTISHKTNHAPLH